MFEIRCVARFASVALVCTVFTVWAEPTYVVDNYAIEAPLTATPGDVARGRAIALDRASGNCLSCHALPEEAEFFGTTGPSLVGVARRLSPAQLRLRLVDSKVLNPNSMMPSYYKTRGLNRVAPAYAGRPILDAQQIEDVVAYLATLD
ncbi:MAG: sulfur oxidation c-type cytochrome SoxX [Gammaproteobacteria bacterium]